ncbi:MAG: hypothetical protein EON93_01035 [Burkholderiales bacterium]|nr:MAG: hypothetical protein EON93_01035 [Burkholderiales bacterium]
MSTETADTTATMGNHLRAAIDLITGKKKLKSGLFFCASGPLDREQRLGLAATAVAHERDIVHLEFTTISTGTYLTGLNVIISREGRCLVASGCQLYLAHGSQRARIVPQPNVVGHFTALPGELLHRPGRPADLENGVQRAADRLARMAGMHRAVRGDLDVTIVEKG